MSSNRHAAEDGTPNQPSVTPIDTTPRLLLFGPLGPTKDVPTTIAAFRQIRDELPDAELVIAGGDHAEYPGYHAALADRYGREPGVRFTGFVEGEELEQIWQHASILLMPHRDAAEVTSDVRLAKAYGLPVIGYDSDEIRRATVGTGGAAEFVPPNDARALGNAVTDLWSDQLRLQEMRRQNLSAGRDVPLEDLLEIMAETAGIDPVDTKVLAE